MKNLVAASALGSALVALVLPSIGGPMHYQVTKPFSLFGMTTVTQSGSNTSQAVTLGAVPLDFVITDVSLDSGTGSAFGLWLVEANGVNVAALEFKSSTTYSLHLQTGIPLPIGTQIRVVCANAGSNLPMAVTVCGYVQ